MKKHHVSLPLLALGSLLAVLLIWRLSPGLPRKLEPVSSVLREAVVQSMGVPPSSASAPRPLAESQGAGTGPAPASLPAPLADGGYGELTRHGVLMRQEARRFEAQKWEVDLAKALELPASARLERRSGVYRVDGFKFPLVRVDRVYRMDRAGAALPPAPMQSRTNVSTTPLPPSGTSTGTGPLDAGGGEVVWENAMVADHLMVQVQPGISGQQLQAALPRSTRVLRPVTERGLYLVAVPADGERSLERAVLALNQLTGVIQFAEPDFLTAGADTTPNDPLFGSNTSTQQWHLGKIRAPRAWDVLSAPRNTTVANSTVVAVVDTGVDYTHPDLAANIWINPGESGGGKETNNTDDDASGQKDDWRGWNFVENNNDPMDDVGHGTHVAGIIGAVGNNATGATGVCWGVKILPVRIIKAVGAGTYGVYSDAIAALVYIRTLNQVTHRVAVANHSWGGNGYSLAMLNAINNPVDLAAPLPSGLRSTYAMDVNTLTVTGTAAEIAKIKMGMSITGTGIPVNPLNALEKTVVTIVNGSAITLSNYTTAAGSNSLLTFSNPIRPSAYGVVHVAAAGNSRQNSDRIPTYPAALPSAFMVSVGATDSTDAVSVWAGSAGSNYGRLNVDLFAPGTGIWSTKWKAPGDASYGYESRSGTSMAAPQVAGAAALLRMWQPALTDVQAREILIYQVDLLPGLKDKCISGGRLNIARMIDKIYSPALLGSGGATSGTDTVSSPLSGAVGVTGRFVAGDTNTLAVRNGKVLAWGNNSFGSLGVSPSLLKESGIPLEVPGLDDVIMVAVEAWSCFALKADGTVWSWGAATSGILGNGQTSGFRATPGVVPGLTDIIWISAGSDHALAVRGDGVLFVWGGGQYGKLGQGNTSQQLVPVPVPGLTNIVMAEASDTHTIALKGDGTVYCWGLRGFSGTTANALGDGPLSGQSNSPILVSGIGNVVQVAAGQPRSLALKSDGTVWQWGVVGSGGYNIPTQVAGLTGITQITISDSVALAIDSNGRVFGWGSNNYGQLGNGSFTSPTGSVLSEMLNPSGQAIVAVSASTSAAYMIAADGSVYAAGSNGAGLLGAGTIATKYYPVAFAPSANFIHVSHGSTQWSDAGFAVDSSGAIYRWGGSPSDVGYLEVPTATTFMAGAREIKIRNSNVTLYRKADNSLWGWGYNSNGELGQGNKNGIYETDTVRVPVASTVVDFSPGSSFSAAVLTDGRVQTWGSNLKGQLGTGDLVERLSPFTVQNLPAAQRVAAGAAHTLVIAGGNIWAWGDNSSGQLGDGTTTQSLVPKQITNTGDFIAIAATDNFSFALKNDGSVWSWGSNSSSGCGLGYVSPANVTVPTQIPGLTPITALSVGRCALMLAANGTVWAWGSSAEDVGRGPSPSGSLKLPGQVVGLSGVVQVTVGDGACHARKSDGTWWVWGYGTSRLGDGDNSYNTPIVVLGFAGTSTVLSSLGTRDTADSWLFQNFSVPELLNDSLVSDTATPAGDGIPNLLKYALGLDPRLSGASALPTTRVDLAGAAAQSESASGNQVQLFSLPTVDLTSGKRYTAFTVNRNGGIRQDIDYIVEVSNDLQSWHSGDPFTITVLDTAETLEVYDATAIEDAPRRFMRLRIRRK